MASTWQGVLGWIGDEARKLVLNTPQCISEVNVVTDGSSVSSEGIFGNHFEFV